jgi:hypothetical protein
MAIQGETAVFYAEGSLMTSVVTEIRELRDAVQRIEAHLGIRPRHDGSVSESGNRLAALGWSEQEIDETRSKLSGLEQEWNDPSMDEYDRL